MIRSTPTFACVLWLLVAWACAPARPLLAQDASAADESIATRVAPLVAEQLAFGADARALERRMSVEHSGPLCVWTFTEDLEVALEVSVERAGTPQPAVGRAANAQPRRGAQVILWVEPGDEVTVRIEVAGDEAGRVELRAVPSPESMAFLERVDALSSAIAAHRGARDAAARDALVAATRALLAEPGVRDSQNGGSVLQRGAPVLWSAGEEALAFEALVAADRALAPRQTLDAPGLLYLREQLAWFEARNGNPERAVERYRALAALVDRSYPDDLEWRAALRWYQAIELDALGRFDEVLALTAALDELCQDPVVAAAVPGYVVHSLRANALSGLGRIAEAVEAFEDAVASVERSEGVFVESELDLRLALVEAYNAVDRFDDALEAFDAAAPLLVDRDPASRSVAALHLARGQSLSLLSRTEEAVVAMDLAAECAVAAKDAEGIELSARAQAAMHTLFTGRTVEAVERFEAVWPRLVARADLDEPYLAAVTGRFIETLRPDARRRVAADLRARFVDEGIAVEDLPPKWVVVLAKSLVHDGSVEPAEELFLRGLAAARRVGDASLASSIALDVLRCRERRRDADGIRDLVAQFREQLDRPAPPDYAAYAFWSYCAKPTVAFAAGLDAAEVLEWCARFDHGLPAAELPLICNRVNTLWAGGHLVDARWEAESALQRFAGVEGVDPALIRLLRSHLAGVLESLGDTERALLVFDELVAEERDAGLFTALFNRAVCLAGTGRHADALMDLERVIEGVDASSTEGAAFVAHARSVLAGCLDATGRTAEALEVQRAAVVAYAAAAPEDHATHLELRSNLAHLLLRSGALEEAAEVGRAVARDAERALGPNHPETIRFVAWCLGAFDEAGLQDEAVALLPRVVEDLERGLDTAVELSAREAREYLWGSRRSVRSTAALARGTEWEERQFEMELRREALLDALARTTRRSDGGEGRDTAQSRLAAVRAEITAVAGRLAAHEDAALRARLTELVDERDALERELRHDDAVARAVSLEVADVAAALSEGELFVRFRDAAILVADLVDNDGFVGSVVVGRRTAIEAEAERWRSALGAPVERGLEAGDDEEDPERAYGAALRALLLDPVLDAARAPVTALRLRPDGIVHLVPVDALPEGDGRVGDRLAVEVVATLDGFAAARDAAVVESEARLVALGAPSYGGRGDAPMPSTSGQRSRPGSAFAPLVQTGFEAEAVGMLFEEWSGVEPTVLKRGAATKAALFEATRGVTHLHLATHGWFAPELGADERSEGPRIAGARATAFAPLTLCGLALTGANAGLDADPDLVGIVTAEELCSLDLSRCELAVLSACETYLGVRRAGQGIQSLRTALHAAGTRASVTSLWKVDDAATRRLFELFYTYLWFEELAPAAALWRAKRDLREGGHPVRDWAGWVLSVSGA